MRTHTFKKLWDIIFYLSYFFALAFAYTLVFGIMTHTYNEVSDTNEENAVWLIGLICGWAIWKAHSHLSQSINKLKETRPAHSA